MNISIHYLLLPSFIFPLPPPSSIHIIYTLTLYCCYGILWVTTHTIHRKKKLWSINAGLIACIVKNRSFGFFFFWRGHFLRSYYKYGSASILKPDDLNFWTFLISNRSGNSLTNYFLWSIIQTFIYTITYTL